MKVSNNWHCSVVEIAGTGVMIEGSPGSGKTSLAFGLLDAANARQIACHFIADDQAFLETVSGTLIARPVEQISGKAEVRGFGIVQVDHKCDTTIGLLVRMLDQKSIDRMPEPKTLNIQGIPVPLIEVPSRHESGAVRIVLAKLGLLTEFPICK